MDGVHDCRLVNHGDGAVVLVTPEDPGRTARIHLPQFGRIVHFLTVADFLQLKVL